MASVVLSGDTSGSITLSSPAVAGSNTQTLVATTGTLAPIVSDTAKTATSTSVDFTGIPSWVKRITVMFQGVSTSGASVVQVQLGSGTVTTSGYVGSSYVLLSASVGVSSGNTSGFLTEASSGTITASTVRTGSITLNNITGNTWVANGVFAHTGTTSGGITGGSIALSGTLDRVRVTTVNGTDTFDAGTLNILYE